MACGICSRFLDFFSISFISLNNKFFEKIVLVISNKRHLRFASSFHYRKSVATNIRHGSLFWETTSASTLDGKRRWRKLAMNKHCLERKCTSTIVNRPPCTDEGKKKKERTNKKRSSQFHRNLSLSLSLYNNNNISRETFDFFKNFSPLYLQNLASFFGPQNFRIFDHRGSIVAKKYKLEAILEISQIRFFSLLIRGCPVDQDA